MDGISHIINDVQLEYNGEPKFFITGFEAGAHTVWQFVFQHPERLKGAAPVAGNYNKNSCMSEAAFSNDSSRNRLPIKGFSGKLDTLYGAKNIGYIQWQNALRAATEHGYNNITETVLENKGHTPMPQEVLEWFYLTWKN